MKITKKQMEKIISDFETRDSNNLTEIEYCVVVNKMQKIMLKDVDFKKTCQEDTIAAIENSDLVALKQILKGMFPISELFTKDDEYMDKCIERFVNNICARNVNYFRSVDTFMAVYARYGCMGLNTNLNILERELKNPTLIIRYKSQIEEIADYEKFMLGTGGDLMTEAYKQYRLILVN